MNPRYFIGEHARGVGVLLLVSSMCSCRLCFVFLVTHGDLPVGYRRACTRGEGSTAAFRSLFNRVPLMPRKNENDRLHYLCPRTICFPRVCVNADSSFILSSGLRVHNTVAVVYLSTMPCLCCVEQYAVPAMMITSC